MNEKYQRLWDTAQFDLHYLSNGIKVWLQRPVITVDRRGYLSVFFEGVGSTKDFPGYEGLAHYLEHMLFHGSHVCSSEEELTGPVLKKGGIVNAETNFDFTEFYVETNSRYFLEAVEVLGRLVQEPIFSANGVENERKIILQEFNQRRSTGLNLVHQHIIDFISPKGSGFMRRSIGFPNSIRRVTREVLLDFYNEYFHSGNANIICGGDFSNVPNVLGILEKVFGDMRRGNRCGISKYEINFEGGGTFDLKDRRYGRDGLGVNYIFPHQAFEDGKPLQFLFECLNWSSSSLRLKLRNKKNLIYSMGADIGYQPNLDAANFECFTSPNNFSEVLEIFFEALSKLTEAELDEYNESKKREIEQCFLLPIGACKDAAQEIISHGRIYSFREIEVMGNNLNMGTVLKVRDELLKKKPIIFKFRKS